MVEEELLEEIRENSLRHQGYVRGYLQAMLDHDVEFKDADELRKHINEKFEDGDVPK